MTTLLLNYQISLLWRRGQSDIARPNVLINEQYLSIQDTLLICHPHWHGIRQATIGQAMHKKYPVLLADELVTEEAKNRLLRLLQENNIATVIVNGCPPGTVEAASTLNDNHINVQLIWHGQPTRVWEAHTFENVLKGLMRREIKQLGLIKPGLQEMVTDILGSKVPLNTIYTIENWPPNKKEVTDSLEADEFVPFRIFDGQTHIGLFGWDMWIKNIVRIRNSSTFLRLHQH